MKCVAITNKLSDELSTRVWSQVASRAQDYVEINVWCQVQLEVDSQVLVSICRQIFE